MKNNVIHLLFLIFTLSSCGLFRHTTHEKKVVKQNVTAVQSFVDTSLITEHSFVDTTIQIGGSNEDIYYFPVNYDIDTTFSKTIDNNRYKATIKINPKTKQLKASIQIKDIAVPIKLETIKTTKHNIHASSLIDEKTKVIEKKKEYTPSINWNWVIPICVVMILFFVIIFFKTKKLFTLL